ncbi:HlyD family type I secretion periplasmic adaptor subunit [Agrobacterium sp. rho-13.3]|uniref:HlyD family type I secretion periplasmic adaptor subunit n=1 Tax=Agrobacterium sp. rho-13.3 TaxID=3072980 RepID=UPI002A172393|nr:HlyD family type I secretion periplasmic adaptor subunit [Agrobacterium sp. rho-13.3]MDX8306328.1 HlyD family type I secretion periplasmic adaptor subunit [Agrobacterium sp. rho-13.3]MDX8307341.1 HlyD family type I secretion periplasmic adaptor subunit [Agrobacterium sp. rho-13.3]
MSNTKPFDVSRSIRHHLLAGVVAGVVLVGGAGAWASVTSLSGAVVAPGHFVVDSYVKKVQHPTGGVVGEILVGDGDVVKAGDVLMRLDATQTRANLSIVTKRLDEMNARLARLEAERDDLAEIVFPESILARRANVDVASAIHSETRLFEFRKESRQGKKAQLSERIAQFLHEIEGLKAQEAAYRDGMEVLNKEITSLTGLREQGVVSDQRLNGLKTQVATFGGERGEKIAYQAQVAGRISETKLQILQIDQDLKSEVGRELREVQAQIGEYVERKVSAEDNLKRIDIIAPQSGVVHQLTVHTVGGVISPAEPIMSIVPEGDDLALEVQIAPKDIDQISIGHTVVLRMSAFSQRTTPQLNAHVTRIAADLTTNERTGMSYYVVRLTVPEAELAKLRELTLVPGMPAEAMIQTGDRTALSYLMKPLSDQINRAFREE